MLILGLNAFHGDAAACLVRDGCIVAAAEEERFRRIKHWAGFPSHAISYCLSEAKATLQDLDVVAINSDPRAALWRKTIHAVQHRPQLALIKDRLINRSRRLSIASELEAVRPNEKFGGRVVGVEHHLAHLASAFLVSPFQCAAVASIDGFGDFSSAAWGLGERQRLKIDNRVHFPHSLGVFYQAMTQHLGFLNYGDEYKVMGLAPYGETSFLPAMRDIVQLNENGRFELNTAFFRHHREKIAYTWDGGPPDVGTLYAEQLEDLLGPARRPEQAIDQRHRDLARSTQAMYEEALFHLLNHLYAKHRVQSLALAGGCAMNSVANGKVLRETPFRRLYVQPAAGDAGGAVGAAIYVWHQSGLAARSTEPSADPAPSALIGDDVAPRQVMEHAYLGPAAGDAEIEDLLARRAADIRAAGCTVSKLASEPLVRQTASAIAEGKVVGWFQGRMEWGPRALGNRSIIADPRRSDMKDILNRKIKRREDFRPFAPSVQREHAGDWFEEDADVPFMMQVYQVRPEKRRLIPAVTHVDGSGRLQTVHRQTNLRYWSLIEEFRQLTGVPMVLNTSFNENEPIVCRPDEALDCFLRTGMDMLVLENHVIVREGGTSSH